MKESMYEYFDGEQTVAVSDLDALAKIMNMTNDDPDAVESSRIPEIVRQVFPMKSASDSDCVILWQEFLAFMYARSVIEDA